MPQGTITVDGNEAAARIAYAASELMAIYPITPSSAMGESAEMWAAQDRQNIFGTVPNVIQMQSEAGAAGAVHGSLQMGVMTTTFTASQGLLLMLPNMYKIAGQLMPAVIHVAARTLATHALSIFGDHSDVMSARMTGWAMLCAANVQEAQDMALVSHAATLRARVPFMHFFDGFRTSHEVNTITPIGDDVIRHMLDEESIREFRERALDPDHPTLRGSAQNPDVFFQAREACNRYYDATPAIVQEEMDRLARLTGRQYHNFAYSGHPNAERVIVIMGSGASSVHQCIDALAAQGERVGVVTVRLYRPFDTQGLVNALPKTVRKIAVLDRCKEPGAVGEPLYQDVIAALHEQQWPTDIQVIGGRYGLSSKEFKPGMAAAIFDELSKDEPLRHFTVGINDDVTHLSLDYTSRLIEEPQGTFRSVFFGLGSDGTVGANKNSVKIIAENTDLHAQGYFVYDSKKSGSTTISHVRFGEQPIDSAYLIDRANFIAVHQWNLLDQMDVLNIAETGATMLLNCPFSAQHCWDQLTEEVQQQIIDKEIELYVIDASNVAAKLGLGARINTIMQTCFFAISGVIEKNKAIEYIKASIVKAYSKRGQKVVDANIAAVDGALDALHKVEIHRAITSVRHRPLPVPDDSPDFVKRIVGLITEGKGDLLPVSALPVDGVFPTATSQYEKRSIAREIPIWEPDLCTQCGMCSLICPHAAIRTKSHDALNLGGSPEGFKAAQSKGRGFTGPLMTVQVAPDDCTGCSLCVNVCPAKDKQEPERKAINMKYKLDHLEEERKSYNYFLDLPAAQRKDVQLTTVRGSQLVDPLFEFSGACAGCGETPYLKLMTQLFGDRLVVANATGCSSIFGGNLPTTPWACDSEGRGPAWANSLFEDNAEFGLGMRLAANQRTETAKALLGTLNGNIEPSLKEAILDIVSSDEDALALQRDRVMRLKQQLEQAINANGQMTEEAKQLLVMAEALVPRSVWIVGGDGWAYDIGFGGVDHVLSTGADVNVLVMDTQVYSNTGGQASKATPRGAVAKFATTGKSSRKKDLGMIAASYGNVYVAQTSMGANPQHTLKAITEAQSYKGPSLVIAYSPCVAHGTDLAQAPDRQKLAVKSGFWPLYRYDPRRVELGKPAMQLDSREPTVDVKEWAMGESRFASLMRSNPEHASELLADMQSDITERWASYQHLTTIVPEPTEKDHTKAEPALAK